jgi:hypothetical protein
MRTRVLVVAIAATTFVTPALGDYMAPPPFRASRAAPPAVQPPVVAGPAYPVPRVAAPCFYYGLAFSNGSTNPAGEVCEKGSWR